MSDPAGRWAAPEPGRVPVEGSTAAPAASVGAP